MALKALKEKKVYEKELENIDGILNTIHQQKSSLENAAIHAEILALMANASAALKSTRQGMDVDKVFKSIIIIKLNKNYLYFR